MPGESPNPILSARFERALVYAVERHRHQSRKGTEIPYVSRKGKRKGTLWYYRKLVERYRLRGVSRWRTPWTRW